MFKFYLYKFGQFLVKRLPLALAYGIAEFISDLQYLISFRDRRAVKNNLRLILSDPQEVVPTARELFRNFGRYLVEFFRMGRDLDLAYIEKNITIQNIQVMDRVLKLNKGGILLTAHIGNWELGGVVLTTLGYKFLAIALPHKERPVNDLFNSQRERKGITIVQTSMAFRRCVETLKENGLIALLADRDFSQKGEVMDFLGKKALIPKGPALFSQMTGAPIIPIFLTRGKDRQFLLTFEEPIFPVPGGGNDHENHLKIMRQYASLIEKKIKQFPSQWLMFREFWVNNDLKGANRPRKFREETAL